MRTYDVVVVGAGPAGLSLATELAARGARTGCIDPEPAAAWTQQLGGFLEDWTPAYQPCIEARWAAPSVVTSRRHHVLDRCYVSVDPRRLHAHVHTRAVDSGVQLVTGTARDIEHDADGSAVTLQGGDRVEARLVVDATGTGHFLDRAGYGSLASQVSHGELVEVERHPFRCGEMALMDFRPVDDGERLPTFLHALPLAHDRLYVQETSLVSTVPVSRAMLERRLRARMQRFDLGDVRVLDTQKAHVPMTRALPVREQRTLGYGAAAAMVHPATGHHVARSLARAPAVAQATIDQLSGTRSLDEASRAVWRVIWPGDDLRKWELYGFGARFMVSLDQDRTERFFDAFFSLPGRDWSGFFAATPTATQLAATMSRVFARLDPELRWDLMRLAAGAGFSATPIRAALAM